MEEQWINWINSNIYTKTDVIDGENMSVKEYFRYLFESIIIPEFKRRKIAIIYDNIKHMTERALNVYFWMWIAFNKNTVHSYLWKSHSRNSIYEIKNRAILEYVESQLFPYEFWNNIQRNHSQGYFSAELSDFGRIFWNTLPGFMIGHISLEHSSGLDILFGSTNEQKTDIFYGSGFINNDVDPYINDYINNNQYP